MYSFIDDQTDKKIVRTLGGDFLEIHLTPFNFLGKDEKTEVASVLCEQWPSIFPRVHRCHILKHDEQTYYALVEPPHLLELRVFHHPDHPDHQILIADLSTKEKVYDVIDYSCETPRNVDEIYEEFWVQITIPSDDMGMGMGMDVCFARDLGKAISVLCQRETLNVPCLRITTRSVYNPNTIDEIFREFQVCSFIETFHTNMSFSASTLGDILSNRLPNIRIMSVHFHESMITDSEDWRQVCEASAIEFLQVYSVHANTLCDVIAWPGWTILWSPIWIRLSRHMIE